MSRAERFIKERLQQRSDAGILRSLQTQRSLIDFCSNDYLGFARSEELMHLTQKTITEIGLHSNGATGSRLISGNTAFVEDTEAFIATFHNAESGLIFNSGYDANLGLISSLAQRGDTIISDGFIHASLIDGARLTHANRYTFKHNDLVDLETKLKAAKGNVYVIAESIYSMGGDIAPLLDIANLCERYEADLIVDEAHALGVFGEHGRGIVDELDMADRVFARVVTFGKALGCHGAIVLGSRALRQYLINFARPFVYSTSLPPHSAATIKAAYDLLKKSDYSALIKDRIMYYTSSFHHAHLGFNPPTPGTIQTILYKSSTAAKLAAQELQNQGLDVRAIVSPTVREGEERLRICLHLFNTNEEIDKLINALKAIEIHE